MTLHEIPRYKGPRLPHKRGATQEQVGIRFLVLRFTKNETSALVIRARNAEQHRIIAEHALKEARRLRAACEILGGGKLNITGSEMDVWDASANYGQFNAELVCAIFTEAIARGEIEERKVKPFIEFTPRLRETDTQP